MASTFFDRLDQLGDRIPTTVDGKVEVDQVYAHYQHEGVDLEHPRGGQPFYLKVPMVDFAEEHTRRLAKSLMDPGGAKEGMQDVVEDVARGVHDLAPREFGDLRNSAHPTVAVDGAVEYDRPPLVPRLTEKELREKDRLRRAGHGEYPLDHPQHISNRPRP